MLILISTARAEYVTEVSDTGIDFMGLGPLKINPKKTCEVYRVRVPARKGKGTEVMVDIVPMENPRTEDLKRLAFEGPLIIDAISCVKLNEVGPFAQGYYRQMGNEIIPASIMPPTNGKGLIHKA